MTINLWDFAVYAFIFATVIFTDWRFHKIFNWTILAGLGFALFTAIYQGHFLNSLLGCLVGFGLMVGTWKVSKGAVGMGDIKLGALIGLVLGFPTIFWALAGAMIAGGAAAAVILLTKRPVKELPLGVTMSIFTIGVLAVLAS
jgi:Flp pilus assembly protein protease CpaA